MSFKLNINELSKELEIEPSKIFRNLKRKPIYSYPRDVQDQVWSDWYLKRNKKNLVIKMNTGSGKTVVGLTILQSSLNESKGPALYLCPNKQLAAQVTETANDLNISVTEDIKSSDFQNSKSICVVTIQKLVNGLSAFGVNKKKINIGSIIIDDAHACLDIIEEQFTLEIPRSSDCGQGLWSLFSNDIKKQYGTKHIDLENCDPHEFALIPYWDWQEKIDSTYSLLFKNKDEDFLKFKWDLVKRQLNYSNFVCTHKIFEISPFQIPIDVINALRDTSRIIFMTATMADDSILFSHFNVEDYSNENVVQPKNCNDIGERLIVIPQALDTSINDEDIKSFCKDISKSINVVVIVPSYEKSESWSDYCDLIIDNDNIDIGIERLKSGHVGLVVLVNRYDGIDLPDDACRLLVIDGLPPVTRYIDKIENDYLGSFSSTRLIQKIEQGIGRGVRSNLDYCSVILMGTSLTNILYNNDAIEKFSPATRAQYELSAKVAEQVKEQNFTYKDAINMCLQREDDWTNASKLTLNDVISSTTNPSDKAVSLRRIYNASINDTDIQPAIGKLQDVINETESKNDKGYLKQILATYLNMTNPSESQEIQLSAKTLNNFLLTPLKGISYSKMQLKDMSQAQRCMEYLKNFKEDPNKLIILSNDLIKKLNFGTEAKVFEKALAEISQLIGFESTQPDATFNKGPDVLLHIDINNYLIIECKNQASNETISKDHCGQLLNSTNWFRDVHKSVENSIEYTSIIVHPSNKFDYHASPDKEFRVITDKQLSSLKTNISSFIEAFTHNTEELMNTNKIHRNLINFNLLSSNFIENYTCSYTSNERKIKVD
ncbi:DEAD/DEAH box helicase family protein [Psychrobacter sp.]|uniref:DEAD/DEAH box helicase family protein n=1 Tax=Psychrobacter sp. TaxID=56811 RepID=UPI0035657F5C